MTAAGGSVGSHAGGAGCAGGGSNSFSRKETPSFCLILINTTTLQASEYTPVIQYGNGNPCVPIGNK